MKRQMIVIVLICIAIFLIPGGIECFEYDRSKVLSGEVWRLISCHFVHYNIQHLVSDLAGFLICGLALERLKKISSKHIIFIFIALSLGIHHLNVDIQNYSGLSSLNFALLVMLALNITYSKHLPKWVAFLVLALPLIIIWSEWEQNKLLFTADEIHLVPATSIHILGCFLGLSIFYFHRVIQ